MTWRRESAWGRRKWGMRSAERSELKLRRTRSRANVSTADQITTPPENENSINIYTNLRDTRLICICICTPMTPQIRRCILDWRTFSISQHSGLHLKAAVSQFSRTSHLPLLHPSAAVLPLVRAAPFSANVLFSARSFTSGYLWLMFKSLNIMSWGFLLLF